MKQKLLLLCGGRSDEHEISLISAKGILGAIDRSRFEVVVVGITKAGEWLLQNENSYFVGEFRADKIQLNPSGEKATIAPYLVNGRGELHTATLTEPFDVVFPILHGPFGEDGTLQGMLDLIGIPYVGSPCGSSWMCMDKAVMKTVCEAHEISVSPYVLIEAKYGQIEDQLENTKTKWSQWNFPLFVKPARLGSSVGISKVNHLNELMPAVLLALRYDTKVLVEKGIRGREIETAVLGLNSQPEVALPGEVIPSAKIGWYSYEAKYLLSDGAQVVIPAALDATTCLKVQQFAKKVYQALECEGLARVDLFIEDGTGKLYLNEPNTLPGFTPISMYPKMWEKSGLSYQALVSKLIDLAFQRKQLAFEPNRS